MNNIKKLIHYFFHHHSSEELTKQVHRRLLVPGDEQEKEEALQEVWEEIGYPTLSSEQMNAALARLDNHIGQSAANVSHLHSYNFSRWLRIAAMWFLPLLFLSTSLYFYQEAVEVRDEVVDVVFIQHYVPAGKRELLTLPDGSKVWLNSASLLVYPSTFVGNKREIYLAGEGYFDVQKNPKQPFVVKTKELQVAVLGTCFNLSAYPAADKITATLEHGSINVNLEQSQANYMLKPDEQLIYTPKTGEVELQNVQATLYSDWKEGGLFFKNCPFDDVLSTLERTYGIRIHLQTSIYKSNRLTIPFNKHENLENVMMLIKEMIPGLEYRIEGKEVYIIGY